MAVTSLISCMFHELFFLSSRPPPAIASPHRESDKLSSAVIGRLADDRADAPLGNSRYIFTKWSMVELPGQTFLLYPVKRARLLAGSDRTEHYYYSKVNFFQNHSEITVVS